MADTARSVEELEAEVETLRMQLVACDVAALGNTEAAKAERLSNDSPYRSAAYLSVCAAVDREIQLRADVEAMVAEHTRLLMDEPSESGNYVHLGICNFNRRKSVIAARCNCPISRPVADLRKALSHLQRSHEQVVKALEALAVEWDGPVKVPKGGNAQIAVVERYTRNVCASQLRAALASGDPAPEHEHDSARVDGR